MGNRYLQYIQATTSGQYSDIGNRALSCDRKPLPIRPPRPLARVQARGEGSIKKAVRKKRRKEEEERWGGMRPVHPTTSRRPSESLDGRRKLLPMVENGKALPRSGNRKEGAEARGSLDRGFGLWLGTWPRSSGRLGRHDPAPGLCSCEGWKARPRCRSGPAPGQARATYSLAPCAFSSDPRRSWARYLFGICSGSGPVRFRSYFGFGVHSGSGFIRSQGPPTPVGDGTIHTGGRLYRGPPLLKKFSHKSGKANIV